MCLLDTERKFLSLSACSSFGSGRMFALCSRSTPCRPLSRTPENALTPRKFLILECDPEPREHEHRQHENREPTLIAKLRKVSSRHPRIKPRWLILTTSFRLWVCDCAFALLNLVVSLGVSPRAPHPAMHQNKHRDFTLCTLAQTTS